MSGWSKGEVLDLGVDGEGSEMNDELKLELESRLQDRLSPSFIADAVYSTDPDHDDKASESSSEPEEVEEKLEVPETSSADNDVDVVAEKLGFITVEFVSTHSPPSRSVSDDSWDRTVGEPDADDPVLPVTYQNVEDQSLINTVNVCVGEVIAAGNEKATGDVSDIPIAGLGNSTDPVAEDGVANITIAEPCDCTTSGSMIPHEMAKAAGGKSANVDDLAVVQEVTTADTSLHVAKGDAVFLEVNKPPDGDVCITVDNDLHCEITKPDSAGCVSESVAVVHKVAETNSGMCVTECDPLIQEITDMEPAAVLSLSSSSVAAVNERQTQVSSDVSATVDAPVEACLSSVSQAKIAELMASEYQGDLCTDDILKTIDVNLELAGDQHMLIPPGSLPDSSQKDAETEN